MTISTTTNKVTYNGDDSTVDFATTYRFLENADLAVYVDTTLQSITTDYSVTGAGDDAGGTVTFTTAPATGETVTIKNSPPETQETDYVENDPFPAESHENALDKLTLVCQSINEEADRAIKFAVSSTSSATMPEPSASRFLQWNAAGTDLTNSDAVAFPDDLTGKATNYLRVNSGETAYEFRTPSETRVDISAISASSTNTLTNKTIDADNNTISNLKHGAEVDNPSSGAHGVTGSIVGTTDTQTLTNKTINLANNALAGTTAEFNSALSDDNFATLAGAETLTNKVLTSPDINAPDIDGGTIDGTTIGGATPAAGTFTTMSADTLAGDGLAPIAREIGGTAYQSVLNFPLPPSLDFKAWDYRSETNGAPSIATFARASSAYSIDATGELASNSSGVLRHNYAPVTGEYMGWQIEEARTNLALYSEQFDNAAWTKTRLTISADAIVAPDGLTSADKIVEDTSTNTHIMIQNITTVSATAYEHSIYAKAGERSKFRLRMSGGTRITVDLAAGTASGGTITDVGNGWYRISGNETETDTSGYIQIEMQDDSGNVSYTGDGTSGFYIWGAQLEAGSFITSYIKTTSAAATRAADILSVATSVYPFNSREGTLYIEVGESTSGSWLLSLYNDADNVIDVVNSSGSIAFRNESSGSRDVNFVLGTQSDNNKIAVAFKDNDFAGVLNGGTVATDSSGTLATGITALYIGSLGGITGVTTANFRHVMYFPRRLEDAEIQTLTS